MNELIVWGIMGVGTAIALNMLYDFAKQIAYAFKNRRRHK